MKNNLKSNYRNTILSSIVAGLSIFFLTLYSGCSHADDEVVKKEDIFSITDTVQLFAEDLITTVHYERDMAISVDFSEIIYTLGDVKQSRRCLVSIKKINDQWTAPEILSISGEFQDIEPFLTLDGQKLYFASDRPIYNDSKRSDYNIWYSSRVNGVWTDPVPLDSTINSRNDEYYPSLSRNGNLYFTSTQVNGIGREDIYMSEWGNDQYGAPKILPESVNTPSYEFNSFIDPDENYILFSSYGRKDGLGGGDLYISTRDSSGQWSPSINLGEEINTKYLDYCPFVDAASGNLYFTSERFEKSDLKFNEFDSFSKYCSRVENGLGNIYKVSFKKLGI